MAKPMLVTLPFVLLLLDYWPLGRWLHDGNDRNADGTAMQRPLLTTRTVATGCRSPTESRDCYRLILEKVPLLVLAVFLRLAIWSSGSEGVDLLEQRFTLSWRIGNVPISYVSYLGMFFYPVGLAIPYPRPGPDLPLWKVLGAVLVLVVLTWATLAEAETSLPVGWLAVVLGNAGARERTPAIWRADHGRPLYVLAADWAVHRTDMGIGRCVEALAASSPGVRHLHRIATRSSDGLCVASNVFLARQYDSMEPHAGLHLAEQDGAPCPWHYLTRPRPD